MDENRICGLGVHLYDARHYFSFCYTQNFSETSVFLFGFRLLKSYEQATI